MNTCPACGWSPAGGECPDYCPVCGMPLSQEADRETVTNDILALVNAWSLPEHLTFREALPSVVKMMDVDRHNEFVGLVVRAFKRTGPTVTTKLEREE